MDSGLLLIIIGVILIIVGAGFTLAEKIKKTAATEQERIELKHEKKFAKIAFGFTIAGALLAGYQGSKSWKSNNNNIKSNQILSDSLFRTQERLEKNARLQLDTAITIISLTKQLSDFQAHTLNELTGGKNLPAIAYSISGSSQLYDTLTHQFLDSMIEKTDISFQVINAGKYPLKDVVFSIKDNFSNGQASQVTPYNYKTKTFSYLDLGKFYNVELRTLALKSRKVAYVAHLPVSHGNGFYVFDIILEWTNGLYQTHIELIEKNGTITASQIKFYDADGKEIDKKTLEQNIRK